MIYFAPFGGSKYNDERPWVNLWIKKFFSALYQVFHKNFFKIFFKIKTPKLKSGNLLLQEFFKL